MIDEKLRATICRYFDKQGGADWVSENCGVEPNDRAKTEGKGTHYTVHLCPYCTYPRWKSTNVAEGDEHTYQVGDDVYSHNLVEACTGCEQGLNQLAPTVQSMFFAQASANLHNIVMVCGEAS